MKTIRLANFLEIHKTMFISMTCPKSKINFTDFIKGCFAQGEPYSKPIGSFSECEP